MRLPTLLLATITACLLSALFVTAAWAIPPLPSSFYGRVKFNGGNVPDGTLVRALIDGQAYAEGRTQTYQADSVYTVDVPGDETSTTARDGGIEGDVIQFEVGGIIAEQTGVWHSGTNVELNLTITGAGTLGAPPPTPQPVPTQTPINPSRSVPQAASTPATTTDNNVAGGLVMAAVAVIAAGGAMWFIRRRR
jgi:hypothetical protein